MRTALQYFQKLADDINRNGVRFYLAYVIHVYHQYAYRIFSQQIDPRFFQMPPAENLEDFIKNGQKVETFCQPDSKEVQRAIAAWEFLLELDIEGLLSEESKAPIYELLLTCSLFLMS